MFANVSPSTISPSSSTSSTPSAIVARRLYFLPATFTKFSYPLLSNANVNSSKEPLTTSLEITYNSPSTNEVITSPALTALLFNHSPSTNTIASSSISNEVPVTGVTLIASFLAAATFSARTVFAVPKAVV